jgi:hypothetical protein
VHVVILIVPVVYVVCVVVLIVRVVFVVAFAVITVLVVMIGQSNGIVIAVSVAIIISCMTAVLRHFACHIFVCAGYVRVIFIREGQQVQMSIFKTQMVAGTVHVTG